MNPETTNIGATGPELELTDRTNALEQQVRGHHQPGRVLEAAVPLLAEVGSQKGDVSLDCLIMRCQPDGLGQAKVYALLAEYEHNLNHGPSDRSRHYERKAALLRHELRRQ